MSDLRLKLDTIDFKELVELGRSMIPTVAPGWTDHNVHDPGIMLMELVAWIADAQIYALSRSSRAEREAYGHLLGLTLTGARAATGLIWPFAADAPPGTLPPWVPGTIVKKGTKVTADRPYAPVFYTTHTIELARAHIAQVITRSANGSTRDWTRSNTQRGATFLLFGANPTTGDRLELTLQGTLVGKSTTAAPISIGFEIVQDRPPQLRIEGDDSDDGAECRCAPVRLSVSLTQGKAPWRVSIEADSTGGLAHSGVLLLTVDGDLAERNGTFTLSIRSDSGGFLLPPRVQRIALNVLPVEQVEPVSDEEQSKFGTGLPDQTYKLRRAGLVHPLTDDNFTLLVAGKGSELESWTRTADLSRAEPDAAVYAVDVARELVMFGNGINGRMPRAEAGLRVEYSVTAGAEGNLPGGIEWTVAGVPAPFGSNSEAMTGGGAPRDLARLKADARRRIRHARPIVTSTDLEEAARAFTDLDVRRAEELLPGGGGRRLAGARVLVAVGPHDSTRESASGTFEESTLWLGEMRRRLAPRLPLGQSLTVVGPRPVTVRVVATLVAAPQLNPADVRAEVEKTLREKLAITATDDEDVWPIGRDLTTLTVKGWLRNVDGVAAVVSVSLRTDAKPDGSDRVELGPISLPRLRIEPGDITVTPSPIGGRT